MLLTEICEGLLIGAELLKDICITKAHSSMVDSSQKLETWNTMNIPQEIQYFGEVLFCFFSRQHSWSESLLGSSA